MTRPTDGDPTTPAPGHLEVVALPTTRRFTTGDDLAAGIIAAADAAGITLASGDVVCVASKVVSLVEGATITLPHGTPGAHDAGDPRQARRTLARQQASAIVADAPQVVVTRTPHGFVTANGGIDASNVASGHALLLPEDPDASAERLRQTLADRLGVDLGIVVTDTFGRPWRLGQTDVALGVAGTPALRDERGAPDLDGRALEVTEAAIADEVAAAADLVRTKASGTPFVLLRGLPAGTPGTGADLVRDLAEDLFPAGGPTAAERAVSQRRTVRRFEPRRAVPPAALEAAVRAAATAAAPHHTRPWRFIRLTAETRSRLLDAMAERWRADLAADGVGPEVIARRVQGSDRVLRDAPELLVPFVVLDGAHDYPDERRASAERDLFLLSGGAALANLQIVLAAHGLGAAWMSSTAFCAPTVRAVLDLDERFQPLGTVAIGWPSAPPEPRAPTDIDGLLLDR